METSEKATSETNGQSEKASPLKTFRSGADIENFYRFVYENNLRKDAKSCLEAIVKAIKPPKKTRGRRKKKVQ